MAHSFRDEKIRYTAVDIPHALAPLSPSLRDRRALSCLVGKCASGLRARWPMALLGFRLIPLFGAETELPTVGAR